MLKLFVLFYFCGTILATRHKRIVGGDSISIEKVPFVASMEYIKGQICGAAILNEYWVITATHCFGKVFRPDASKIRVGTNARNEGGTEHRIVAIRKYPNFKMDVVDNDVALIMVSPQFEYSDKVRPIDVVDESHGPKIGDMLTILGWGYTKEKGAPSQELRAATAPVYDHQECNQIYKNVLNVTTQMLCVGYANGGQDACLLDSGGPLVGNGTLMGLVSWGWGCGRPYRPGVYTDLSVPHIRRWITKTINFEK